MMTVGSMSVSVGDEWFSGMTNMSLVRATTRDLGQRLLASVQIQCFQTATSCDNFFSNVRSIQNVPYNSIVIHVIADSAKLLT